MAAFALSRTGALVQAPDKPLNRVIAETLASHDDIRHGDRATCGLCAVARQERERLQQLGEGEPW